MQRALSTVILSTLALAGSAQQTRYITDPQATFLQAKEYFQRDHYSLAYPLFKELNQNLRAADHSDNAINYQEIKYYTLVCALKQQEQTALDDAINFVNLNDNTARVQMMQFHLAEYYFREKDYAQAVKYYEQCGIENLSNREVADKKFHQGYTYFILERFNEAKPLFDAVRQLKDDPNYMDANYYYSFLLFKEGNYKGALDGFKLVEKSPAYQSVVPYYIATIHYNTGDKKAALEYAERALQTGNQFYDAELRQLVGHAYFEKREFSKALPYLETYVSKSAKVTREDMYELSYCYYQTGNYNKAIDGFKQLSGNEDSLSQNAMYLLGDAYLKTNQKANARNAFMYCATNSSNAEQKEISRFNYGKLSYELGYQAVAQDELGKFITDYPNSTYNKEARELMVSVLAGTNNYKDALKLLEGIPNPSETVQRLKARVYYGRAMEFVNDGLLISANDLLDKALHEPYNQQVLPYVQFWKGEISFRLAKIDDAIRYFFDYLKNPQTNGEVNPTNAKYNLGYCFLKKENYKQALDFFSQLVTTPRVNSKPLEQDAYVRMADCYYMSRDYKKALSMYDQVIGFSWPSADYATFQKAMVAGVSNSNEKIKLLQGVSRLYPSSTLAPDANMEIAGTYMADEKFREAIPFLKNVVTNTSNEALKPKAYLKSGIAYYNLDNNKEALNQYNALLKQYPNAPEAEDALENARIIYVEEGRTSEYINFAKSMGRDISVSQEDSLTYAEAEIAFSNGDFNAALGRFDNYLSRFPDGKYAIDAYYYRSEIYSSQKNPAKAATGYEAVADRVPNKFGEKALLQAARLNFFDLKDYEKAEQYFTRLKEFATTQENKLEAMRGLLRSQYQLKKWSDAEANAKDLLQQKGSSADDKVLANMALAKSAQMANEKELAISYYNSVVNLNKGAYGAEARYEIASIKYSEGKYQEAEKAAFDVVNKSGSYELWVTKAYILLGDIYFNAKDYFNAKATYQSIIDNASIAELKEEAQQKLNKVKEEEKKGSKIEN